MSTCVYFGVPIFNFFPVCPVPHGFLHFLSRTTFMAYPYLLILSCLLFRTLLLNCLSVSAFIQFTVCIFLLFLAFPQCRCFLNFLSMSLCIQFTVPIFFLILSSLNPFDFQNFLMPAVILFPVSIFYSFPLSISIAFKIYFLCFCFSLLSLFLKVFSLFP